MGGGQETSGAPGTNAGAMGLYDTGFNYGGGGGGDMWGGVGKGLQQLGSGIAGGGQVPNFMTSPQFGGADISQSGIGLKTIQGSGGGMSEIIDLLKRLGIL